MKAALNAACLVVVVCAAGERALFGAQAPVATPALESSVHQKTIQQYCLTCHSERLKTGGLSLEAFDLSQIPTHAATWEQVVRKLRVGAMPPFGAPRPDRESTDRLIAWLEGELDRAAAAQVRPGRPVLRRLNRAEYANAVRDLLALDVDVTSLLPPDEAAFGFDNVADAQNSSPALLEAYLAAARKISAVAVGDPDIGVGSQTYSARQDLSQDVHLDGLPLGTVGGVRASHVFPADAEYDIQIRLYRTNLSAIRGLEDPQELEVAIDGTRIHTAKFGGRDDLVAVQTNPTDTSDAIEATRFKVRVFVNAGQHDITAAFLETTAPVFETTRLQRFVRDFANPFDAEGAPHVQSITIQGPYNAKPLTVPPSARVFSCSPPSPASAPGGASARLRRDPPEERPARATSTAAENACARRIVSTLARRAYRRPVPDAEVDDLLSFYARGRNGGTFRRGVQLALRRMLASPSFVFRPEAEPVKVPVGTPYRISDWELASRLSFFLWSTIPDAELMRVADERRLSKPDVLAAQVRRMMADARFTAFVKNFAGQWLQLRNLRGKVPNSDLYPDFDDNLRQAFEQEAELFFDSVIKEDRSALDLMTADYTFVNERLARHYGIAGVFGSYFRRVTVSDAPRRGLLGKGAVLLATSHPTTTSPVLRGKWVLENVLGAPPPSPPADLDTALKSDGPGAPPRTMREQMELHRRSPLCANCHRNMDPIGFALENFDVVGAFRTQTADGLPIKTDDVLTDGTPIRDAVTLRQALLRRPDVFVQTLTEKLMVYALGRGLTAEDMPAVRAIVRNAGRNGYKFADLVLGIVNGSSFQMRVKSGEKEVAGPGGPGLH
jgi:mono/diheme cytochrome c family protein